MSFWIKIVTLCLAMMAPALLFANTDEENGVLLVATFDAIEKKDWVAVVEISSQISDPVGADLVTWERLRNAKGDWSEYRAFLAKNGDWPGLKRLRREGENAIPSDGDPALVRAYFAKQPPQTGVGALLLAQAYSALGRNADAHKEAIRAWTTMSMTPFEEIALYEKYKRILYRHNVSRLDTLLWLGLTHEAERMFDRVPDDYIKLARAWIGLQRATRGVDALIAAVPKSLKSDPGLAFNRFEWRIKKGRWDDAQELIVSQASSVEKLGRPEAWAKRRRGFVRRIMRAGKPDLAYRLASQHGLKRGSDYADLEWLSGYISLTKMNAPEQALEHFLNFQVAVGTPISLGRSGYWLGRTYEKLGKNKKATKGYGLGAKHQTSFYGQLAAEKLGHEGDKTLNGKAKVPDWRTAGFLNAKPIRAGLLFHHGGDQARMRWFFAHVAEELDKKGLAQLAELSLELKRPHVVLAIGKEAAKRGIVLPKSYFPLTELAAYSVDVEPELALAIARRESEFSTEAISSAGARGLMQIMPATARKISKNIGVEYSKERLTSDWRYNAQLGTAYLKGLIERYDGSYILAFAAYNAGPHQVKKWIAEYGDPRDSTVDEIDWIEHIPFRETRNYVMRVMESLHVYRARLKGKVPPLQITQDLTRG